MYVLSAKIPCFPLNLSPSQSHDQHDHKSTSECWGMPDGVYKDHFLYLEGVILVDFGRKNKFPPRRAHRSKKWRLHGHLHQITAIQGDLACLNAYNGV